MSTPQAELEAQCGFLRDWFARYGADPRYEIEARLKDVTPGEYAGILSRLQGNPAWARRETRTTVDVNHYSGLRSTYSAPGQPPTYLRKEQVERADVYLAGGELVRFAVATEERLPGPPGGNPAADPPKMTRWKTRHSFNHKHEVLYELTEVKAGATEAEAAGSPVDYEVELEWVGGVPPPAPSPGRPAPPPAAAAFPPEHCAKKFVFKVGDLVQLKRAATGGGGAPAPHR